MGSFLPSQQSIFIPVCTFYQRAFFCSSWYNGKTEGGRLEQHTVVRRTQNAPGHKAARREALLLVLETTLGDTFFVRVADNESLLGHNNIF